MMRPRRNRKSPVIREMIEENKVDLANLIYPIFIENSESLKTPIASMPGIFRFGMNDLFREIEECLNLGITSFALFPAIDEKLKKSEGEYGVDSSNYYLKVINTVKNKFPSCNLMSDVALDPYSSDGHDGIVRNGEILNDESIEILKKMALLHAQAGVDIVGPSDMMDGRVGTIRSYLDLEGFQNTSIMAYTAKYASSFYGPFRDALDSAPKAGDKKTYQMNPANRKEALLEAGLDFSEGADFLMVKPALSYLDIISDLSANFEIPIAAYNVSGEYAMVKAASNNGWLDNDEVMQEILLSIKRAGASCILTYFAKEFALLRK